MAQVNQASQPASHPVDQTPTATTGTHSLHFNPHIHPHTTPPPKKNPLKSPPLPQATRPTHQPPPTHKYPPPHPQKTSQTNPTHLMRPADQVHVMRGQKLGDDIVPKEVRDAPWVAAPSVQARVGVGPVGGGGCCVCVGGGGGGGEVDGCVQGKDMALNAPERWNG
jgi:hypothetical protein